MVASLLRLAELDWPVPDYSTLCRRQKTLKVQIPYRHAGGPLNLLGVSTGIKFIGDGEWQVRKHGVQGRRQWRKVPWPWTPPPLTYAPSSSPAGKATAPSFPSFPSFSTRSRTTKTSAPLPLMAPSVYQRRALRIGKAKAVTEIERER
jgi:hypothetical protein